MKNSLRRWPRLSMTAVAVALLAAAPVAHAGQAPAPSATTGAGPTVRDVEARSYATRPESEPPRYTRPLSRTGLPGVGDIHWLDVGLDYRLRYEYRYRDLRRPSQAIDDPLLLRTRAFVALRDVIDPLRAVELEDARRYGSQYALDARDVNVIEPIQAYAELYVAEGLGAGRPLSVKAGRMAFEALENLKDVADSASKAGSLEFWSSGGLLQQVPPGGGPVRDYDAISIDAKHIHVITLVEGQAAVAQYYSEGSMKPKGSPVVPHYFTRVTEVYVKEGGRWKVRAAHWSAVTGGSGTSQTSLDQ